MGKECAGCGTIYGARLGKEAGKNAESVSVQCHYRFVKGKSGYSRRRIGSYAFKEGQRFHGVGELPVKPTIRIRKKSQNLRSNF
jgi:hypothetical protein